MAFNQKSIVEVNPSGSDDNGGGFSTAGTGFNTDGEATAANTSAPVFTSASYTFVAGDQDDWVYIKTGTNWTPGLYKIASVAGGAATLEATIGLATIQDGILSTVVGCATVESPTGATWGIDRSRRTAAYVAFTDLVIDAVTNTKCTSVLSPFVSADAGQFINITAGTGWTVQRVEILSVTAGVATCDKALGTVGSIGGTGNMGGALLTVQKGLDTITTADMTMWVKGTGTADYLITAGLTCPTVAGSKYQIRIMGYRTTRGDGLKPEIKANANTITPFIAYTTLNGCEWHNFILNGDYPTRTGGKGPAPATTGFSMFNCVMKNFGDRGFHGVSGRYLLYGCEVTNCANTAGSGAVEGTAAGQGAVMYSWIHANPKTGGYFVAGGIDIALIGNRFEKNTGATSDGCEMEHRNLIVGNIFDGNGRDGLRANTNYAFNIQSDVANNIFSNNTAFGLNVTGTPAYADNNRRHHNGYYNNTSGARSTNINKGVGEVDCTADPFTDSSSGDFTLNNTAGGGAELRAAGFPGVAVGSAAIGYQDIGLYQHEDAGGGGGGQRVIGG